MKNSFRPNTFIVGVQKAGTTALVNWLAQHPDVLAPEEMKDYDYFGNDTIYSRGDSWFVKSFTSDESPEIVIHGHVYYSFIGQKSLERIKEFCKDSKVIVVLRNPSDRAYSAYWEYKKTAREQGSDFKKIIYEARSNYALGKDNLPQAYLEKGLYSTQVEDLYKVFDKDQIKICIFEDIIANKQQAVNDIFNFLEVESFDPKFNYVNESGLPRSVLLQRLLQMITLPEFVKRKITGKFLTKIKANLIRKVNVRKVEYPPLDPDVRVSLNEFYKRDIEKLEGLTGLNCEVWRK